MRDRLNEFADSHIAAVTFAEPRDLAPHRAHLELPFPLLADPDKQIVKAYGATLPLGLGVRRVSYLIGRDGVIADRAVADLRVGPHEAFVDRVLARGG